MSAENKPGIPSKVPQYRFAGSLAAQEAQLAANPMLARFAQSRRELARDPHRPLYHFVSPESTLNDPNGLCFWNRRWHLFYQGYPPEDSRQHWGHAVSDDLIHWRDLPYAIYPDPEDCCYSGSALVEDDRVIAIYHGTRLGNMVATSTDPLLLNWQKVGDGAAIPLPQAGEPPLPYTVFDPCIWKKGEHTTTRCPAVGCQMGRQTSKSAPTSSFVRAIWSVGNMCIPSSKTTNTRSWVMTAPAPISGPSARTSISS